VLEGSVSKAGPRVRITGPLIDAISGTHLWADRFEGSLEDVFELQDEVAISVAGVIEPALQVAESRHSANRPTTVFQQPGGTPPINRLKSLTPLAYLPSWWGLESLPIGTPPSDDSKRRFKTDRLKSWRVPVSMPIHTQPSIRL
jgi:hypothetical protein